MKFERARTAIKIDGLFVGVFQNVDFFQCGTGIDMGGAGSITLLDSTALKVGRVIATGESGNGQGSIVIDNLKATSVGSIVQNYINNRVILAGSEPLVTVGSWVQGNVYLGLDNGLYTQRTMSTPYKPPVMLDQAGKFFTKSRPVYAGWSVLDIVNVKNMGAKGDGRSDDTAILNSVLRKNAQTGKITYFPHGYYVVTDTIYVPPNSRIMGEVWSAINGKLPNFARGTPRPYTSVTNLTDGVYSSWE
jgi:glucan 1,3-beta-glucosidase